MRYIAWGCLLLAPAALAAPSSQKNPPIDELAVITVSATKSPRAVQDTPGTVTVMDREDLDRELVRDIQDLVRYEPGVTVRNQVGRFGLSDFNIRGIEGNRVLIEVDGIRLPDSFLIGDFSNANRNFVDLDLIKRVEIVRGPASSLYGSDAIGGVVSFETKDPEDLTGPNDATFAAKGGAASDDDGHWLGFTGAAAGDVLSGLFSVSRRDGHEQENQGENDALDATRTTPNPQDYSSDAGLGKIVVAPGAGHRFELTLEDGNARTQTDVISARRTVASGPSQVRTTSLTGDDRQSRQRGGLEYTIDNGFLGFDHIELELYGQKSSTVQASLEQRQTIAASGAVTPSERFRRFDFDQDIEGAQLLLRRDVSAGSSTHRLVFGAEYRDTETRQQRDGFQRNPVTGVVTTVVGPDAFPVRDFPLSTTRETGVFAQDEISLFDDRLLLIPGVRWDGYDLHPNVDPVFAADNPGITPVPASDDSTSPKLGVLWRLSGDWSLVGQYARGFRAPPYNDVNVGFTNLAFGYTAIPNPDLQPETSDGYELGVRYGSAGTYFALTGFVTRYDDFIESFVPLGVDPDSGLLVFQSQNLEDVEIRGVELSGRVGFDVLGEGLRDFSLRAAVSYARGDNETADEPLNSVSPPRAVLGLGYAAPSSRWGAELVTTAVQSKSRVDDSAGELFRSPGYATLDLLTWCRLGSRTRVEFGVFNMTDRKYWEWADVRGRPANDPAIDRYTRPGANAALQLRVEI